MEWYRVAIILVTSWIVFTTVIVLGMTKGTRQVPVKVAVAEQRKVTGRAIVA